MFFTDVNLLLKRNLEQLPRRTMDVLYIASCLSGSFTSATMMLLIQLFKFFTEGTEPGPEEEDEGWTEDIPLTTGVRSFTVALNWC